MRIGQAADLVVVAPATADLLARAAMGRADDLLTATLLTAPCPVVFVPAMHTEMWLHPATQDNVATLRRRGRRRHPAGRRAGSPAPTPARAACRSPPTSPRWRWSCWPHGADALAPDLAGRRVVVTAGGTREPLDPVRYLGNRSSGKQGYALARVGRRARRRGHARRRQRRAARAGRRPGRPVGTAEELRAAMLAEAAARPTSS